MLCTYFTIPVVARFSSPVQTGHGTHTASYTAGTDSFLGVKRPGRFVDHQPPYSAEVKEIVELYLLFPLWALVVCSRVNFTFTLRPENAIPEN